MGTIRLPDGTLLELWIVRSYLADTLGDPDLLRICRSVSRYWLGDAVRAATTGPWFDGYQEAR